MGRDVGGCRLRLAPDRVCSRHRALRHQRRCRRRRSRPRRCSAHARRRRRRSPSTRSFAANNAPHNTANDGQHGHHDDHVAPLGAPERVELGDDLQLSGRHEVRGRVQDAAAWNTHQPLIATGQRNYLYKVARRRRRAYLDFVDGLVGRDAVGGDEEGIADAGPSHRGMWWGEAEE